MSCLWYIPNKLPNSKTNMDKAVWEFVAELAAEIGAGAVFLAHFGASALSALVKSYDAADGLLHRFLRRAIDCLALNFGHARPASATPPDEAPPTLIKIIDGLKERLAKESKYIEKQHVDIVKLRAALEKTQVTLAKEVAAHQRSTAQGLGKKAQPPKGKPQDRQKH